jgi:hypothetical protein|tara:strand:+ start:1466 stop:1645 length:180 start_codon:yes stop_codon:yes gene_type:complete
MKKENIKFTPTELSCLLDMVEQDIDNIEHLEETDNDECIGELHKETLKDIYKKLVILNK